ncbi:unnamed protein product [Nippostrongylus brasiliensis]|uniref:Aromatic-L-amino-acid decarboxylase (inferred by orthology to a human protein) n=1 Tax=Nippostrongylus brasiliensis TaxID=27835 RepID=A0A158R094_NIPBR|nr:unnamed protein product [Nippostrongylus brasiliensis]
MVSISVMVTSYREKLRKKITVLTINHIEEDVMETLLLAFSKMFTVNFVILKSASFGSNMCEEISSAAAKYSSHEGKTSVILLPHSAPLPSCTRSESSGSVIYVQQHTQGNYRYGKVYGDRNSDKMGSKENVVEYIAAVTTATDPNMVVVTTGPIEWKSTPLVILTMILLLALLIVTSICVRQYIKLKRLLDNPVTSEEFVYFIQLLAEQVIDACNNPFKSNVTADAIPGEMYKKIPLRAPETPDTFEELLHNIRTQIHPQSMDRDFRHVRSIDSIFGPKTIGDFNMACGLVDKITHWQHPRFHAFFPCGRSFPDMLGDFACHMITLFSTRLETSPALTELENVVVNWVGRALSLPESFLFQEFPAEGKGGGFLAPSASNAVFCAIIASLQRKVTQRMSAERKSKEAVLKDFEGKFVVYINCNSHPYIEKACQLSAVVCRRIQTKASNSWGVTGAELEQQVQEDIRRKFIPLFAYCTVGTTATAIVDHLDSIGPVAERYGLWMHCDCSFGGNCWIVDRHRPAGAVLEYATSINVSLHKFMLHGNGDLIYTKEMPMLSRAFQSCQESIKIWNEGGRLLCDWGVSQNRRVQALRIWLAMRINGLRGLQYYVDNEPHFTTDQINYYTSILAEFMNESKRILVTLAQVSDNNLIGVAINYERSTKTTIENSWKVMKSLLDEFENRKDSCPSAAEVEPNAKHVVNCNIYLL